MGTWLVIALVQLAAMVFQVRMKNWLFAGMQFALVVLSFIQAYAHWSSP